MQMLFCCRGAIVRGRHIQDRPSHSACGLIRPSLRPRCRLKILGILGPRMLRIVLSIQGLCYAL